MGLETLTLAAVTKRMQAKGMRVSPATVADGIEQGIYPFGSMIKREGKHNRRFIIYEADFEKWSESNDGMYIKPNIYAQGSVQAKPVEAKPVHDKGKNQVCPFLSVAQREKVVCDASCALYIQERRGDGGTCAIAILAKKN